jgi:hypothetical protein
MLPLPVSDVPKLIAAIKELDAARKTVRSSETGAKVLLRCASPADLLECLKSLQAARAAAAALPVSAYKLIERNIKACATVEACAAVDFHKLVLESA